MIWTIVVILLVLWALGLVTSTSLGGFIHILLVLAIIVVLFRVIQGRRAIQHGATGPVRGTFANIGRPGTSREVTGGAAGSRLPLPAWGLARRLLWW